MRNSKSKTLFDGMKQTISSEWKGTVFIWHRRALFVGVAGDSEDQKVHAIKICVALDGDFELSVTPRDVKSKTKSSEIEGRRYSAAIINSETWHTVRCQRTQGTEIFLLYLLPETEEARKVRDEFLSGGESEVYDLTKESAGKLWPLPHVDPHYSRWDCKGDTPHRACEELIRSLGEIYKNNLTPSTNLSKKLAPDVKNTIEDIYSRLSPSMIATQMPHAPKPLSKTEGRFRQEVGITVDQFFKDIQLLATLEMYAIAEEKREEKEAKLITALEEYGIKEKEREAMRIQLRELAKKTRLEEISKLLGFRHPANLSKRIDSRLGVSHRDLKGGTDFLACEKDAAGS